MSYPFLNSTAEANPLTGIVRCIRKICLLREQGNLAGAVQLEQSDLATVLRDLRLVHGPEFLPERELLEIFVAEEKRVADAVVLCSLLIPQLRETFSAAPMPMPLPYVRPVSGSTNSRDSSVPFAQTTSAGAAPMIADLLDAMLAPERSGRHSL